MKKVFFPLLLAIAIAFPLLPSTVYAEDSAWLKLQQDALSSGTITLTRDIVCDNQEYGPITIPESVTVTIDLNGHKIDRNLTEAVDKGVVLDVYGSLTVKDSSTGEAGMITGGYNTGTGNTIVAGGIQVSGGELVLESGSITGCSTDAYGAGVSVEDGSFLMTGGSINGNYALSHGGGVGLTSATFTMTGGSINGNRANMGGGVRASTSDLFLSGGGITGNEAIRYRGGGLEISGDANVTLTGCQITGNTAVEGGGVSLFITDHSGCSFKVGKNTIITGNTDTDGNDSNLYLENKVSSKTMITILDGEDAPDGMNIGISSRKVPVVSNPVPISTSSAAIGDLAYFSSDSSAYDLIYTGGIIQLAMKDTCGVTFKSGAHGTDPAPVLIEKGGLLTRPKDPSEYGYSFLGWYKDAALQDAWDFGSDSVNENLILYGKWEDSAWLKLQQDALSSGTITLTRDIVCDNQEYGPITIPESVTITIDLNGHKIDRNLTEAVDKGVVLDVYGSLTVKDSSTGEAGMITGGYNTGAGNTIVAGGIQVSGGELVLESGSITGCSTDAYGAGVSVEDGSFLMTGGSINGNYALSHGGGVGLTSATFTMTGGSINGNRANMGGGVRAGTSDLFLSGGVITGNEAIRYSGGGLEISGDANVTLTGCQITGNTAVDGGGVSLFITDHSGCSFKVGKNTIITGNTDADGNDSNLYLENKVSSKTMITILDGEDAPDGMNIGISSRKVPVVSNPVPISDATMQREYMGNFSSDSESYWIDVKDDIMYLTVEPPTCYITYTSSDKVTYSGADGELMTSAKPGDTVRFKVTPDSGYTLGRASVKTVGGVSVTPSVSGGVYSFTMPADDVTVTAGLAISVPDAVSGLIYDGNEKTGVEEGDGYTLTGNTAIDAGNHTATAVLKDGYTWSDGSLENKNIDWTINKATPTVSLFIFTAPEDLVADGKSKMASVIFDTDDDRLSGLGRISVKYQKKLGADIWSTSTYTAPSEPGTYRVLADVNEGNNYTSASDLTMDGWKFTITEPIYTVNVTDDGHGTCSADPTSGTTGTLVSLTASPSVDYEFDHWEVVRGGVTVTNDQFTIGTDDVEIKACFKTIPVPVTLTNIEITTAPDKTIYTEGEIFDGTGMVVTATYSDGNSRAVSDYEFSPSDALSVTDTTVEIRYTEDGVTKNANLIIQVKPAEPVVYRIIIGANQTIFKSDTSAQFASNADFSKFDHVEVDGMKVAEMYYTAESGSTVITFNQDYIQTLRTGEHKLTIVSNDGSASTDFTVSESLPLTGDNAHPALLMMLLIASVGTILLLSVKIRN